MAELTVRAIVLRRTDTGESDRRLTLLTQTAGKLDAVAKGARKSGSRLAGASDPLCISNLTLADGRRLRYITQAQPEQSFRGLRTDYDRLTMALAVAELYASVIPWQEPVDEAFELLVSSLTALESHPRPVVAFLWAQVALLNWSGFMPQLNSCVDSGAPIQVDLPWLSPRAGGLLSEESAEGFRDRFRVRFEVVIAIKRLPEFESPPQNVAYADEACKALVPFWREVFETPTPALDHAIDGLSRVDGLTGGEIGIRTREDL